MHSTITRRVFSSAPSARAMNLRRTQKVIEAQGYGETLATSPLVLFAHVRDMDTRKKNMLADGLKAEGVYKHE